MDCQEARGYRWPWRFTGRLLHCRAKLKDVG